MAAVGLPIRQQVAEHPLRRGSDAEKEGENIAGLRPAVMPFLRLIIGSVQAVGRLPEQRAEGGRVLRAAGPLGHGGQ